MNRAYCMVLLHVLCMYIYSTYETRQDLSDGSYFLNVQRVCVCMYVYVCVQPRRLSAGDRATKDGKDGERKLYAGRSAP